MDDNFFRNSMSFLRAGLLLRIPQLLLFVNGLEFFRPPFDGRLGVLLALSQLSSHFDVPVFSFVAAEVPVNRLATLYVNNYHEKFLLNILILKTGAKLHSFNRNH